MKQFVVDQAILIRNDWQVTRPLRRLRDAAPAARRDAAPTRFLVIPGDAVHPSGSLGDLAMFTALMQSLRARNPDARFTVIGTRDHSITVPGIGSVPVVAAWLGKAGALAFDRLIRQHDALFVMGADILDGKYGASLVARAVDYCNHSVQLGIPAATLGFSFNRHPRYPTVRALARLHPDVLINVRDEPSLKRFSDIVGVPARLCADSAFLMAPAAEPELDAEAWIEAMRREGRNPVGLNLNAHALAPATAKVGADALMTDLAAQLQRAGERHALAFMLIPHDLKTQAGDIAMLQEIERRLRDNGFAHVRYTAMDRPDIIKRVVGLLDLVITGRMHLAIASLGNGTPVLSITYQDKFEGLYQHFGLSLEHTVSPLQCLGDGLQEKIEHAWSDRVANRERVIAASPAVKTLALRNIEHII